MEMRMNDIGGLKAFTICFVAFWYMFVFWAAISATKHTILEYKKLELEHDRILIMKQSQKGKIDE